MQKRFYLAFLLFFLYLNIGWAEEALPFHLKAATQKLLTLQKNLATPHRPESAYHETIETLENLIHQATECTEETQKELENIDILMNQSKKLSEKTTSADLIYLTQQQKKWENIQAECRLFTIRATEALNDDKRALINIKEKATLSRSMPIWTLYKSWSSTTTPILWPKWSSVSFAQDTLDLIYFLIGIPLSLLLSWILIKKLSSNRFSSAFLSSKHTKTAYITLLTLSFYFALLLSPLLVNFILENAFDESIVPLGLLSGYFGSTCLLVLLFNLSSLRSFLAWYNLDYRFARACLFFVLTAFTVALLGKWSIELDLYTPLIEDALKTLYLDLLLLVCFAYTFYYTKTHQQTRWLVAHRRSFQLIAIVFFSIPLLLGILGYLTLALQLVYASFVLATILFFMTALIRGCEKLYRHLYQNPSAHQSILTYFGYRSGQTFTEFLMLKIAIQLIALLTGLFLTFKATGFSTTTIELAYDQVTNGIHIGNMTLYPTRILLGVVVFCLLYLVFRAISTKISGRQQFEEEEETQVAVASLLTYIGFSIAFLVGSLIAGFDFTGLAIIAGALSVGIGLGLQSIVNNFVSGLIILIEKPIKPGDRISIGGVEGVVKKIRVRSTQIMTSAREDIIIPNSDLITQRVVNFMLSDKYCRLTFDIHVAYGTDTYFVRDTLLEIANQHHEVIKTERHKPTALLADFGENALVFQLTCLIKDVTKKSVVRSDIHFEIERIFRERHIEMPFVQREIYLRTDEKKPSA